MKSITAYLISALLLFTFQYSYSQINSDNFCGSVFTSGGEDNDTLFGGRYKPHRSDISGAPSQTNNFPVLIVFVQFQNEPCTGDTNDINCWPCNQSPKYKDSLISEQRLSSSNWWDDYNGYQISDFWNEFSRGKLHVTGKALSVILEHTIDWYDTMGRGINKVNFDVNNILSSRIGEAWLDYDKWRYDGQHNLVWGRDSLADMVYMVFRQHRPFLFDGNLTQYGVATLGDCDSAVNYKFKVYENNNIVVNIFGMHQGTAYYDNLGYNSGLRVHAGYSKFSRQRFLDIATHEHGHYLFGFGHKDGGKMNPVGGDFSFSPWEVIKLDYIHSKLINYTDETNYLYDYSSHGGTSGTEGEVIQIPVSTDGKEFYLLANRRKVSQWDSRMGGDTLADEIWHHFRGTNPDYGKGLYIYHVKNGFIYGQQQSGIIDLECADGLWNWTSAGISRPDINNFNNLIPVKKKTTSAYDEDTYISANDEISEVILFSPGSHDVSYNQRGTSTLYTNENDYWYSLANLGDRWDAWNTGYNEVFSPYSSPNTNDMLNRETGIFVWYEDLDLGSNRAKIKIFRAAESGGNTSLATILDKTPPSKPVGIRIEFDSNDPYNHPTIKWNHNKEPDMIRDGNVKRYKIFKASKADMTQVPSDYVLLAVKDIPDSLSPAYTDTTVLGPEAVIVYDPCYPVQYPLRYKVVAVDNTDKESVKSDFAQTYGWRTDSSVTCAIGPDNPGIGSNNKQNNESTPVEFSLSQNYPNPFNPVTMIKYDLPKDNFVTIKIYDLLGRELMNLVNEYKKAGSYTVTFDAANYPSGVYYYKIKTDNFIQVRKMILLK